MAKVDNRKVKPDKQQWTALFIALSLLLLLIIFNFTV